MESGTFAGAPAEAEQAAQPTPPVESTPAPDPPAPEQTEEGSPAALDEMRQKLDSVLERLPEQPAAPEPAADLLSALEGEPPAPEGDPEPETEPQALEDPAARQQLEELERFVDARADARVAPIIQERREERIQGLQQKYPDIVEPRVLQPLEQQVNRLVQRTGNEDLIFDADVIEMVYKAVKAEQADAGAVPAEQAATQGASLETHAGQSQAGDPSPDEKYKSAVYGTQSSGSVFG